MFQIGSKCLYNIFILWERYLSPTLLTVVKIEGILSFLGSVRQAFYGKEKL